MASRGPIPAIVFLDEVNEWTGDSKVVRNKLAVKVGKAKEGLYILDFGWGWPGSDAVEFHRVHGKLTGFHDHSEVFDFRDVELAFLELEM